MRHFSSGHQAYILVCGGSARVIVKKLFRFWNLLTVVTARHGLVVSRTSTASLPRAYGREEALNVSCLCTYFRYPWNANTRTTYCNAKRLLWKSHSAKKSIYRTVSFREIHYATSLVCRMSRVKPVPIVSHVRILVLKFVHDRIPYCVNAPQIKSEPDSHKTWDRPGGCCVLC